MEPENIYIDQSTSGGKQDYRNRVIHWGKEKSKDWEYIGNSVRHHSAQVPVTELYGIGPKRAEKLGIDYVGDVLRLPADSQLWEMGTGATDETFDDLLGYAASPYEAFRAGMFCDSSVTGAQEFEGGWVNQSGWYGKYGNRIVCVGIESIDEWIEKWEYSEPVSEVRGGTVSGVDLIRLESSDGSVSYYPYEYYEFVDSIADQMLVPSEDERPCVGVWDGESVFGVSPRVIDSEIPSKRGEDL